MQKQSDQSKMSEAEATRLREQGDVGSPISNEAYNILSALHSKLEGLEAYRKYAKDGHHDIWKELADADKKCVETLCGELERMVRDGKFRMGTVQGQAQGQSQSQSQGHAQKPPKA